MNFIPECIPQPTESLEPAWVPSVKGYREDTVLEAVDACKQYKIGILGGHTYCFLNGGICHTGDNWHSEPEVGEPFAEWAVRSIEEARKFIASYRDVYRIKAEERVLFGLGFLSENKKFFLPYMGSQTIIAGVPRPTENLRSFWSRPAIKGYREDAALEAVSACERLGMVIEGGHVHGWKDGTMRSERDYWNSVQKDGEDFKAWAHRSIEEARQFITSYRSTYRLKPEAKILFELGFRQT